MTSKLFEIQVTKPGSADTLRLNYSNRNKMHKAAFALRRAGYKVTGEYDSALVLNQSAEDVLESASMFFR